MSRRRKKSNEPLIVILISTLIIMLFSFIFKIILFLFYLFSYYKTDYKKKTNISFLKMYFDKGLFGEFIFYRKLCKVIDKNYIHLNLYLDNINTDYTEVDIVAITKAGLYVFEVKNFAGWIYGNDKDRYWTQVFNKHSKHKFFNPIRQNYAHTKSLQRYLSISDNKIIPIVTFSMRSKLKKLTIQDTNNVFNFKTSLEFVNYVKKNSNVFSEFEIDEINQLLLSRTLVSDEIKKNHIDSILEVHGD